MKDRLRIYYYAITGGCGGLTGWLCGTLALRALGGVTQSFVSQLLYGSILGVTIGLAVAAYDGMGLETRHLLERSDLHPRPGKDQHAFCLDVDRAGDIRPPQTHAFDLRTALASALASAPASEERSVVVSIRESAPSRSSALRRRISAMRTPMGISNGSFARAA